MKVVIGYQDQTKADPPAILTAPWIKCSHTCSCGAKVWWGVSPLLHGSLNDGTHVRCWKCDQVAFVGPRP